ncbi:MAG: hypothetical protein H0W53_04765 [Acidobacteria bacterium]|jgi:hypothetical protein|nr:hypothetical protein [Acidobacteriota bacterium]
MKAVVCPFCEIVSDHPHETQAGCIEALQAEIIRTRQVLEHVTEPLRPPKITVEEDSSPV